MSEIHKKLVEQEETIQEQAKRIEELEQSLCEARRQLCKHKAVYSPACQIDGRLIDEVARIIAKQCDWDCFEGVSNE